MKKIKIFLASSITEFANERMEIENFIRNVSDDFEEHYDIKLQPLLCENFDDAYTEYRKQEEYNEKIRGSELCFFIFFTKAGEFTQEEFEVAQERFAKNGKPKIHTYFKILNEETAEQSLCDFMKKLDTVFEHYHGTFEHIDTVKLRILLSIKLQEMDFIEIKTVDGQCVIDGKRVLPLDNISEFLNNDNLANLQQQLCSVEEEYYQMKPLYAKGGCDEAFYRKYSAVASKRQSIIDDIEELQRMIFNVSLRMAKDEAHGDITARQKEAYRLFESGDYESCMEVLNSEDIDNDFMRDRKRIKEQDLAICRRYIKEHRTAIEILEAMTGYNNRFSEIRERYEKIVPVALEERIEFSAVLSYVNFLSEQNQTKKALDIAEKLETAFEATPQACDAYDMARLFNSIAIILIDLILPEKAEERCLKAIEIFEKLAGENPEKYDDDLVMSYNTASYLYDDQGQSQKSEKYYRKSIELREKLAVANPEKYNSHLADRYIHASKFYRIQGQPQKAEKYCLKAIKIYKELDGKNPEQYGYYLARVYCSTSDFYVDQGQPQKAEGFYLKAIEILEKLAGVNPEKYNGNLASSYNLAGAFYADREQPQMAEEFYLKAIGIFEILAGVNPEKYNGDLASSYNLAGAFYADREQPQMAEEFYLKAIGIFEILAGKNPKKYDILLAGSYAGAGASYVDQGQSQKAEGFFQKEIELKEKLAVKDPELYIESLAYAFNRAGNLYTEQGQPQIAEEYFLKAIEIYEELARKNPEDYNVDQAKCYYDAGNFYRIQRQSQIAEGYYLKAIEIYEKLVSVNLKEYYVALVMNYNNIGAFYAAQGQPQKVDEYFLKRMRMLEKVAGDNSET